MIAAMVAALFTTAAPAGAIVAQSEFSPAVCADASLAQNAFEGQASDAAAALLNAPGPVRPAAVDAALNTILLWGGDANTPTFVEVEAAREVLADWYGPECDALDKCIFVRGAVADNDDAAENARLARALFALSPPGIDAALALISGEVDESPFHATIAEAVAQIESYFATCVGNPSTSADDDVYETCAYYGLALNSFGTTAFGAVQNLRDFASPNPVGLEAAFDVLADFHDETGTSPTNEEVEAANDTLIQYYGDLCDGLNVCPLVQDVVLLGERAALAAAWAGGMETPAPPGIGAAFALIAREIDLSEQSFYSSEAEAADRLRSYYGRCFLAITGSENMLPMTASALVLLVAGATVLTARRRFTSPA